MFPRSLEKFFNILIPIRNHCQPIKVKYPGERILIINFKLIIAMVFLLFLSAEAHALTPDQVFDKVKDAVALTLDAAASVLLELS